ncbi:hypothetical protein [Flavisericum labens]|uniref:hypothetical protein n=1 Tax=Flavisericum labens TaxID=3377112 RepID=UPI00387AA134
MKTLKLFGIALMSFILLSNCEVQENEITDTDSLQLKRNYKLQSRKVNGVFTAANGDKLYVGPMSQNAPSGGTVIPFEYGF